MKTLTLLFALSLFILATPTHSAFNPIIHLKTADEVLVSSDDAPILDINGNELHTSNHYYILSAIWEAGGGGVKLAQLDQQSQCPSDVIVAQSYLDLGTPVKFTPQDKNNTIAIPSAYYTLSFFSPAVALCLNKQSWQVVIDPLSRQFLVKAGQVEEDESHFFKIQPLEPSRSIYQFVYCPTGDNECFNVGRYYDQISKATRLALSDNPFSFRFAKAGDY